MKSTLPERPAIHEPEDTTDVNEETVTPKNENENEIKNDHNGDGEQMDIS